jgi:hypothetical protein
MRATLQPGWRWSQHMQSYAGTDFCEVQHIGYLLSGRLGTRLKDGS